MSSSAIDLCNPSYGIFLFHFLSTVYLLLSFSFSLCFVCHRQDKTFCFFLLFLGLLFFTTSSFSSSVFNCSLITGSVWVAFVPVSISPTALSLKSVSRHHEFVPSCLARVVIMILRSIPSAAVFVELLLRYSRIFSSNSTVALADDGDDDHHLIPILCLPFSFLIICFFSLRSYSQIHSLCVTKQFFMSLLVSLSSSSFSFGCCWPLTSSHERVSSHRQFCVLLTRCRIFISFIFVSLRFFYRRVLYS